MTRSILPLRLEGRWIGIDALSAREVLGALTWVPLPGGSASLPGVLPWNGRAIAFIDLGAATAVAAATAAPRARTVICQRGGCTFALQVDAVREVAELLDGQFRPPEITRHPFSSAEVELEGALVSVIDLDALLASVLPEAA